MALAHATHRGFVLTLDYAKPIRAQALARLLRDMASDYKRLYGGELVVLAVADGSLRTWFGDAADLAEDGTKILKFVKELGTVVAAAAVIGGGAYWELTHHDTDLPLKTVQALATVAAQSGSKVDLQIKGKGQEEIKFTFTPREMANANTSISAAAKDRKEADHKSAVQFKRLKDEREILAALPSWRFRQADLANLDDRTLSLLVTLVRELQQSSGEYRFSAFVADLERENPAGAQLVREVISQTPQVSPLSITQQDFE